MDSSGYNFSSEGYSNSNRNSELDKYKRDNKGKDLTREWSYQEVWDEVLYSGNVLPKKLTKEHRVVFVDADTLLYRTSSGCETRSVKTVVDGVKVEFPTKTKLKEYCVDVDVEYKDLKVTDHHQSKSLGICISRLNQNIGNLYKELKATHIVFFIGGSDNFRLNLPLPNQYKAKRKDTRRPDHLKACREYLNKNYDCFIMNDVEADDIVQGITGYCINNTQAYCLAYNQDKDFHTSLVKNRYYHVVDKKIVELSGGIGKLYMKKNKVKGDGLHWLLCQVMLGDYDDDFSPKQFFNKSYGDKSYYKQFKDYSDEKELLTAWVEQWQELLPEVIEFTAWQGDDVKHDWLSLAELYWQCPYMKVSPDDNNTFSDLLDKYGVIYAENAENIELITAQDKEDVCD